MIKCKLKNSLRAITLSFCTLTIVASVFSCDSDRLNDSKRKGSFRLSLATDTTGIKGGALTTKASSEFDDFLDIDNYTVQVYSDADTVESLLYKNFPEEIEIKEGNYTLKAFRGTNLPAAFDNPYFEGSKEFTVKEDMKTPLELTCTMANARVKATYSEDFLKAYTNYTVMLKTSHLNNPFLLPQTESRFAYLKVEKEGTPLVVAISLKRENWEDAKVYTVTDPAITLKPKESITLNFATDGKTGDGLALSVVLDDKLTEAELHDTIPDFMWKPFEKPTVEPRAFKNNDHIDISSAGLNVPPTLGFGVPSGIGGFNIWRTVAGSNDTIKCDIATTTGAADAQKAGFSWGGNNLLNFTKTSELHLEEAFKQLEYIGADKEYEFIFFIKDNLPVTNYTDTIHLFVRKVYAAPTIKLNAPLPADGVIEGEELKNDVVAQLEAEGTIKDVIVSIKDMEGKESKYSKDELLKLGATLVLTDSDTKGILTIPKSFTAKMNALADADQTYTIDITVEAKEGIETALSTTATNALLIKCPMFVLAMAPNEGDVFAKRAILRANLTTGLPAKLKFQKKEDNDWADVSTTNRVKEGYLQVDTLKGLTPATAYAIRAVYDNGYDRVSGEYQFTTEGVGVLPNAGFESWYSEKTDKNGKAITNNLNLVYWNKWFPWLSNDISTQGWNTLNQKTTQDGTTPTKLFGLPAPPYVGCCYVANSGTLPTTDKYSGKNAALIRSIGWGSGSAAAGTAPKKTDAGYLYLGKYNMSSQSPEYGIAFKSRPSSLTFYCKYSPKNPNDRFIAKIAVLNANNNVIGEAELAKEESGEIGQYVKKQILLKYNGNLGKAEKIYIVFQSGTYIGANNTDFNYPPRANLSDGEFVGSKLYIDDVELIYE